MSPSGKLRVSEKVAFALGDSASNFYWKVHEFFVLFFYTDVFGLSASAAGTLFLVARAWDAVADPLMGLLADRTSSRWGKFRPYLLWGALPLAFASVLAFTTPQLGPSGKLTYAYVTYIGFFMLYTAVNIPYSALMGVITPDTTERAQLSSWRFVGAFLVALVVQAFTPRLAAMLAPGDPARGWQLVMALYGGLACLLFFACFLGTRERVAPPAVQTQSFRADWAALRQNRPWRVMFGLGTLVIAGFALRGGTLYYYFKYYLRDDSAFPTFMFTGGLASLLGTLLMPSASRWLGKRRLYGLCMALAALLTLPYCWLRPDQTAWIFGLNLAIAFALGPTPALMFAMFTDTADYGEWRTGRRTTGFVMAAAMLSLKLGGALGGGINGWLLAASGFVANQPQAAGTLLTLRLLMGVVPAATCAAAAVLSLFYEIDERLLGNIEQELSARRGAPEPPSGEPAVALGLHGSHSA